jgi:hypothetical protein
MATRILPCALSFEISETGDAALKENFKQSVLEIRYKRDFFQPDINRGKDKLKKLDVEKVVEVGRAGIYSFLPKFPCLIPQM